MSVGPIRAAASFCAAAAILALALPATAQTAFKYLKPGKVASGTGRESDRAIYFPGILFPLKVGPATGTEAFASTQVYSLAKPADSPANYAYPWQDTYCETRSWSMPLCPGKKGHQGDDIRPPSPRNVFWEAVAIDDGVVTSLTPFTTLEIRVAARGGQSAYYCRYLHMNHASILATGLHVGSTVTRGQVVGKVSNIMGGKPDTDIHLHFDCHKSLGGVMTHMPVYTSLIEAYRRTWNLPSFDRGGVMAVDSAREVQ
jgi:murein DD-endopeptidase MepM/ murein hydrolase activator NlpD